MGRASRPYRVPGGWRFTFAGHKRWAPTEVAAWGLLARLRGDDPSGPAPLSVQGLIDRWESLRGNPHSNDMLDEFADRYGELALTEISADLLERYARHLRKRLGLETVRKKVYAAKRVLRYGEGKGWLDRMPEVPRTPKPAPSPKALSDQELADLFADLEAKPKMKHALPLARFIVATGCRPGEARLLRWEQLDLARGVAVLRAHKTAEKVEEPRIIPLSPTALEILSKLPRASRFVFLSYRGRPYTRDGFGSILQRRGVAPYRLRHTWCQHAADAGVPEEVICCIMGHASSAMVRMYRRISEQRVRAAVAALADPVQAARRAAHPRQSAPAARRRRPRARQVAKRGCAGSAA